jgi:hypothetical protein
MRAPVTGQPRRQIDAAPGDANATIADLETMP